MAEPVSRHAWGRLVALLNAYVFEESKAFSHSGPLWNKQRWTVEHSGLHISEEWSFPDRISRAMVKSMFEWSTDIDGLYRAFCACMMFASEKVPQAPMLTKALVAQPGFAVGEEVMKLRDNSTFAFFDTSPLRSLGPVLNSYLLNAVSVKSLRCASLDQFVVDWMIEYGQITDEWNLELSAFDAPSYQRYSDWCQQALDRFRESGHLPDHCDDHAFIGFLMASDRIRTLSDTKMSHWVHSVDNFYKHT